jgi:hypothetical protein
MGLEQLVSWVKGRSAEGITSFSLPMAEAGDPGLAFLPNQVYLEVRVRQIWLTQERELWREFQPFAAAVTEFLHEGEMCTLPTLLGSSELVGKLALLQADNAIEIRNLRVAGPTPYEGDDVRLLIALFRMETTNWVTRTLGTVETIANALGASALVAAKPVADAVVSAITQLLGQQELELRCGQYQSWSSPIDPANPETTELRAMHHVVMRRPLDLDGAEAPSGFLVDDGRLHVRTPSGTAPYTDHDFILLSVVPVKTRDDYKSLPFYDEWRRTQALVVDGDLAAAERAWRRTAGALYSPDLIEPQQQLLYAEYEKRYRELLERFALADEHAFRGRGAESVPLVTDEQDPLEILLGAAR